MSVLALAFVIFLLYLVLTITTIMVSLGSMIGNEMHSHLSVKTQQAHKTLPYMYTV